MLSRRGLILLVAVACSSMVMQAQSQSTLFFDDFETQDFSAWSSITAGSPLTVTGMSVVRGPVHSGLYAVASTLPQPGGTASIATSIGSQTDVSALVYFYIDPAFTITNPVELAIVDGGTSVWLFKSGGSLYLEDPSHSLTGTHAISLGSWHSFQLHNHTGSGNAVETLWLDGALDFNSTSLTIAGPFVNFYLGMRNGDGTQSGSIYFDDVQVATGGQLSTPAANITVRYPNTNARTAFPLDVTMWGVAANDILVASVDGTPVYTKTGSMTQHERFTVKVTSLSVTSHTFQVQLQDSGGTPKATFSGSFSVYYSGTPTVYIDGQNNLYWSGQKFFPVTPYVDGTSEYSSVWAGNSSVNAYGWVACWASNYSYTAGQFDACMNTAGVPFIGPDDNWTGRTGDLAADAAANAPDAVAQATAYVTTDRNNPNLFMWTWKDEPAGQVPLARMLALSQAVWSNDGNHPVVVNFAGYPYSATQNRQAGWFYPIVPNSSVMMADVYAGDMYPFIYSPNPTAPPPNWYVSQMVDVFDWEQRYTYNLVPMMAFIEVGTCSTGGCTGHGPTPAQVTMEAWLGVIHGLKGISWWGPAGWTTEDAAHWAAAAKFMSQVSAFSGAILSTTPLTVTSNQTVPHSRVDATVREDSAFVYVFAARLSDIGESSDPPITASLTVSPFSNNRTVEVPGESRSVSMVNGVITDVFNPSAVHLYCVPKSATTPLPPCGLSFNIK
jgi:hypothetical protein